MKEKSIAYFFFLFIKRWLRRRVHGDINACLGMIGGFKGATDDRNQTDILLNRWCCIMPLYKSLNQSTPAGKRSANAELITEKVQPQKSKGGRMLDRTLANKTEAPAISERTRVARGRRPAMLLIKSKPLWAVLTGGDKIEKKPLHFQIGNGTLRKCGPEAWWCSLLQQLCLRQRISSSSRSNNKISISGDGAVRGEVTMLWKLLRTSFQRGKWQSHRFRCFSLPQHWHWWLYKEEKMTWKGQNVCLQRQKKKRCPDRVVESSTRGVERSLKISRKKQWELWYCLILDVTCPPVRSIMITPTCSVCAPSGHDDQAAP